MNLDNSGCGDLVFLIELFLTSPKILPFYKEVKFKMCEKEQTKKPTQLLSSIH